MENIWTQRAIEPFFQLIKPEEYQNNLIDSSRVICKTSKIAIGEKGVFAKQKILKGHIIEWGIATIIPHLNVQENDKFFTWDLTDKTIGATVSGCGLFYNTLGDSSNARCVPYHSQNRFEIYALEDIDQDDEITFRYDSMNYRQGMNHLIEIVGHLQQGDLNVN